MIFRSACHRIFWLCWSILQLFWTLELSAQDNYTIRFFNESHGLASNFVEAITQDTTGHLVIANKGGVDHFNGKVFTHVATDSDTTVGYSTSIYRNQDEVWFGKFNGSIGVIRDHVEMINTGISGQVKYIHKDQRGGIWAFSRSGMVFWADGADTSRYDMSERDLLVNAVVPYKYKEFIVASNDGLWLIRFESGNDFQVLRQVEGLPETKMTALHYSSDNEHLWVGTEDEGLHIVHGPFTNEQEIAEFRVNPSVSIDDVQSIYRDHFGRVWIGTFGQGLMSVEFGKGGLDDFYAETYADEISDEFLIQQVIEDSEGNIWIATFGGGIIQIVENVFNHPFDENWLRQQEITELFRDSRSNVWLGIDKGIFRTSEKTGKSNYDYYYVGGNPVSAIAEDRNGTIWLGTKSGGVFTKKPGAEKFTPLPLIKESLANAVNSILTTYDKVFVSTKAGLVIYSLSGEFQKRLTTLDGLPHNTINYCYQDSKKRTWIACQSNRVCYLRKDRINFIEQASTQTIADVNHILEDRSGRLWFATMGQGLFVLNDGAITNLHNGNELDSDYCYQVVLDDDDNVWVSHQKSIVQISDSLKRKRLVTREELTNTESSMIAFLFKDAEGSIWISSTHNVVKFNPAIDKSSKRKPQLSISSMLIGDSTYPMNPDMTLPYGRYDITFNLAGISLRNPESITYKYQLKGASDAWRIQEGKDQLDFTGLAQGVYELNVLASKNGGEWTNEPVSFKFSIAKPIWQQWWFWSVFSLIVISGVILFVRYRTYRLLRDKEALEQVVQERTVEINEQKTEIERSRDEIAKYAKDITDSIKYAKRIQNAIFPVQQDVQRIFPECVVFFQPKDLVSGDFYFADKIGPKRIFAAVDCTGHGVPGGFMSIVANNLLQQAIRQNGITQPSEILDYASSGITNTLHQTYDESTVKDGMDVAICCWDEKKNTIEYAGAYNPLYLFRNGELTEIKGDRFPAGTFVGEESKKFTNHKIDAQSGDMLYVFSDGYADQFGGPIGKKYMMRRFRHLLMDIHKKSMEEQYDLLLAHYRNWKGNLDQVDDIIVMGVRIP